VREPSSSSSSGGGGRGGFGRVLMAWFVVELAKRKARKILEKAEQQHAWFIFCLLLGVQRILHSRRSLELPRATCVQGDECMATTN
jgi:hypothetical protein